MKIVHLIQYHLGGGRKRKKGNGGGQTPQLPDAGKPFVESVSYDKDAKKVRLRAQTARAGEVKTPLGDWQEFPIEIPESTPLPDAGRPFVEGVTYDPDTKKVKVRAKVAQAGEVKDPIGEEQEFPIHVPTPPAPPTPSLPDAGKPRVSKFDYDPTTRKVTVQASNAQAGEVKTPIGDEQTFDIPAEPAKPEINGVAFTYDISNFTTHDIEITTGRSESVDVGGWRKPCRAHLNSLGTSGDPDAADMANLASDIYMFSETSQIPLPIFELSYGVPVVDSQYCTYENGIMVIHRSITINNP